jgi:DNA-binding PadR family transcriptional regulator
MSLRHALLALLDAGPMTGYELAKQFDVSVAYVWHAPHSQIYPELRRMEAAGLIEAESLPRGEHGTKRPYSLTEAGAEELVRWVTDVASAPPVRDPSYLKATYYEYGSFDQARQHFREHRDHHRAAMEHWHRQLGRQRGGRLVLQRPHRRPDADPGAGGLPAFLPRLWPGCLGGPGAVRSAGPAGAERPGHAVNGYGAGQAHGWRRQSRASAWVTSWATVRGCSR